MNWVSLRPKWQVRMSLFSFSQSTHKGCFCACASGLQVCGLRLLPRHAFHTRRVPNFSQKPRGPNCNFWEPGRACQKGCQGPLNLDPCEALAGCEVTSAGHGCGGCVGRAWERRAALGADGGPRKGLAGSEGMQEASRSLVVWWLVTDGKNERLGFLQSLQGQNLNIYFVCVPET